MVSSCSASYKSIYARRKFSSRGSISTDMVARRKGGVGFRRLDIRIGVEDVGEGRGDGADSRCYRNLFEVWLCRLRTLCGRRSWAAAW